MIQLKLINQINKLDYKDQAEKIKDLWELREKTANKNIKKFTDLFMDGLSQ